MTDSDQCWRATSAINNAQLMMQIENQYSAARFSLFELSLIAISQPLKKNRK